MQQTCYNAGKIIYPICGSTNSMDLVSTARKSKFIKSKTFHRSALALTKIMNGKLKKKIMI